MHISHLFVHYSIEMVFSVYWIVSKSFVTIITIIFFPHFVSKADPDLADDRCSSATTVTWYQGLHLFGKRKKVKLSYKISLWRIFELEENKIIIESNFLQVSCRFSRYWLLKHLTRESRSALKVVLQLEFIDFYLEKKKVQNGIVEHYDLPNIIPKNIVLYHDHVSRSCFVWTSNWTRYWLVLGKEEQRGKTSQ